MYSGARLTHSVLIDRHSEARSTEDDSTRILHLSEEEDDSIVQEAPYFAAVSQRCRFLSHSPRNYRPHTCTCLGGQHDRSAMTLCGTRVSLGRWMHLQGQAHSASLGHASQALKPCLEACTWLAGAPATCHRDGVQRVAPDRDVACLSSVPVFLHSR